MSVTFAEGNGYKRFVLFRTLHSGPVGRADSYPPLTRHRATEPGTKLKEVRDFHMEKAINSSMPEGQSEENGGRVWGVKRLSRDIRMGGRCEGEQTNKELFGWWFFSQNVQNHKRILRLRKNTSEKHEVEKDQQMKDRGKKSERKEEVYFCERLMEGREGGKQRGKKRGGDTAKKGELSLSERNLPSHVDTAADADSISRRRD